MRRRWLGASAGLLLFGTALALSQPGGNPLLPPPVSAQTIQVTPINSSDFGTVGLDLTPPHRAFFTIANLDTVDALEVSSVTSSNPEFAVTQPTSPITIPPASSFVLVVEFTPTTAGPRSGDISVFSDDPLNNPAIVSVTGYGGVEQSLALHPQDIALALGQGLAFRAVVTFDNGDSGLAQLLWSSSDPAVATVTVGAPDFASSTPTGEAAALALGTTTISVAGVHNPAVTASTSLTVVPVATYRFVATASSDQVVRVDSGSATLLYDFPEVDPGGDPFYLVEEIGADFSGNIYVAAENFDTAVDDVFHFDTSLVRSQVFDNAGSNLFADDMVVDSAGRAILSNAGTDELWLVSPTGPLSGTLLSTAGLPAAGELAIDASDNLYSGSFLQVTAGATVLDQKAAVYRRTPSGTVTPLAALFDTSSPSSSSVLGIALTYGNRLYALKSTSTDGVSLERFRDLNEDGDYYQIVGDAIQPDPFEILVAGTAKGGVDLDLDCMGKLIVSIREPGGRRIERWEDFNGNGSFDDPLERLVIFQGVTPFSLQDIAFDCPDGDGDRVPDAADNCPSIANTNQTDTDGDGLGNACDPDDDNDTFTDVAEIFITTGPTDFCSYPPDTDANGIITGSDVFFVSSKFFSSPPGPPYTPRAEIGSQNGIITGDDVFAVTSLFFSSRPGCQDSDGDGVVNLLDNCPTVPNGLAQEGIPGVGNQADTDGDLVGDACDNCPTTANGPNEAGGMPGVGNQDDTDGDLTGDACDDDDDNDGWFDVSEESIGTKPRQACGDASAWPPDTDGNGIITGSDVFFITSRFFTTSPPTTARADIGNLTGPRDGIILGSDVFVVTSRFFTSC